MDSVQKEKGHHQMSAPENSLERQDKNTDLIKELQAEAPVKAFLAKEDVLRQIDNGLSIYQKYIEGKGRPIKLNCAYNSPLREDKKPSFSLYDGNGLGVCYKDHANGECGDCFKFYAKVHGLENMPFNELLEEVSRDFGVTGNTTRFNGKGIQKSEKAYTINEIPIKSEYFAGYGISEEILEKYNVVSLELFTSTSEEGKQYTFTASADNPIFAYKYEGGFKIYRPKNNYRFQHLGDKRIKPFGYEQLQDKGDFAIITGGEKDVLTLASMGYDAISFNSESSYDGTVINELKERFKDVYVLYDIDKTGLEQSEKLCSEFGLNRILLPEKLKEIEGKDISDYQAAALTFNYSDWIKIDSFKNLIVHSEPFKVVTSRNNCNTVTSVTHVTLLKVRKASDAIEESKKKPIPKMMFSEFLHEGELCCLFGETGTGKSIVAVQIGDSVSKGIKIKGFKNESEPQIVGYLDCELSDKQFEKRYSDNYQDHYQWDDNMLRIDIDSDNIPDKEFEKVLMENIQESIKLYNIKFFIIDNITFLNNELEKGKYALSIIKSLKNIKDSYGITILVLGHTPKRDSSKPITRNDLSGSRNIMNFLDSAFAIGESSQEVSVRYLKQIKARAEEKKYVSNNVIVGVINKPSNFLQFEFMEHGNEEEYLTQSKTLSKEESEKLNKTILEIKRSNPDLSFGKIAIRADTNKMRVKRVLENRNVT